MKQFSRLHRATRSQRLELSDFTHLQSEFRGPSKQGQTGSKRVQAAFFPAFTARSSFHGAMANLTCGSGVPTVQAPLHVAAAADTLAQHDDRETFEFPGNTEEFFS